MLPIQSILNHGTTRTRSPFSQQSGSELSSPSSDLNDSMIPGLDQQPFPRKKKSRDSSDLTYTRPQGVIKYPPFESLDREAYSQIQSFGIYPFGEIGQYCAHIPYSSDKKDVFEKTGRESFHGKFAALILHVPRPSIPRAKNCISFCLQIHRSE